MVQAPVRPSYGNGSVISVKRELVSIGDEAFIQDDEIKEGALELTQTGLPLFCILKRRQYSFKQALSQVQAKIMTFINIFFC